MGIFSTKKTIHVASTVYNMTDTETVEQKPTFMQEALMASILGRDSNPELGAAILNAHLKGPRKTQRDFFRWAKNNYDFAMPRAVLDYTEVIDNAVVTAEIIAQDYAGVPNIALEISSSKSMFIDGSIL